MRAGALLQMLHRISPMEKGIDLPGSNGLGATCVPHPQKYIITPMRQSSSSDRRRGRGPDSPMLQIFGYSPIKPPAQPLGHLPGAQPWGLGSRGLCDPRPQHPRGGQSDTALCSDAPGWEAAPSPAPGRCCLMIQVQKLREAKKSGGAAEIFAKLSRG